MSKVDGITKEELQVIRDWLVCQRNLRKVDECHTDLDHAQKLLDEVDRLQQADLDLKAKIQQFLLQEIRGKGARP